MAQLWWLRWLQSTAIPKNPMTFGMVSTWESTYYPTLHHQSPDEIAILRCSVWTNPFTNPWGQKLEQIAWWLMAEPMRRSSCLGKPNSTNKIRRTRVETTALPPMKMVDWTHVDGIRSQVKIIFLFHVHQCHGRLSPRNPATKLRCDGRDDHMRLWILASSCPSWTWFQTGLVKEIWVVVPVGSD